MSPNEHSSNEHGHEQSPDERPARPTGTLTEEQLADRLPGLPEWTREGDELRRTVQARDFPTAIALVDDVAVEAERMDHHPDIDIRWRTVRFALSTHSVGGLTDLDFRLARRIDELARDRV